MEKTSQRPYKGKLIATHPAMTPQLLHSNLLTQQSLHPRALTTGVSDESLAKSGVARLATSIRAQVDLVLQLLEDNPGLATQISNGKHTSNDALFGLILKEEVNYIERLRKDTELLRAVPNFLVTALALPTTILPPLTNNDSCYRITYNPTDFRIKPFTDDQLAFIQRHELEGCVMGIPNTVAVALLGLAVSNSDPVFYSRTCTPTKTEYRVSSGTQLCMKTTHHAVIFTSTPPTVFDVSPVNGRLVQRTDR